MGMIIDPLRIKEKDLPLIVLVDDRRSFLGWAIKSHSHGNYNHICEMHEIGRIASQDFVGFRERDMETYMKPYIFMKFWSYKNLTEKIAKNWKEIIQADLDAPWRARRYDILGIIGQFLHIRKLQNPHLKYCSERVAGHMRMALKMALLPQRTPSELNKFFKTKEEMEVFGYWFNE